MFLFGFSRRKKKAPKKVERELWYDLVAEFREWDVQWQNYSVGNRDHKPIPKDQFIDKAIKRYKLSEREQKNP